MIIRAITGMVLGGALPMGALYEAYEHKVGALLEEASAALVM